jgi:low temperature requirement protein LtrA
MQARRLDEAHRTATPLELLFDLTFVAAVSQAADRLAHATLAGNAASAVGPFLMVFFAIWWAWMNLTWFASAYDTDDVAYRLAVFVQMAGVLVLAAGVGAAFDGDFAAVTAGYLIMRLSLFSLWVRAARQHPAGRGTCSRYAVGIAVAEVLWLARLATHGAGGTMSFAALAALELLVPVWAERRGPTSWHPHHIAERYSLFTLILLGESILAGTTAVAAVVELAWSLGLVAVSAASLVLVAALWWLHFAVPAGAGLEARRSWSFVWGYGHFFTFAALAALGAGLEVVVTSSVRSGSSVAPVAPQLAVGSVALPAAVCLVAVQLLRVPDAEGHSRRGLRRRLAPAATATAALAVATGCADRLDPTVGIAAVATVVAAVAVADEITRLKRKY